MSFIKKNYEKILLGAVLLGLVGCLSLLPVIISHDQQALLDLATQIIKRAPKPLEAVDMSRATNVLGRVQSPFVLDWETTNRLFNPVQWQKTPDGRLLKIASGNEVGPGAIEVTKIRPLYFVLTLVSSEPANQFSPARYVVTVERQSAATSALRRPRQHFLSVGEKDEALSLVSASGPTDNPQLVLQILDTGETVTITKNKPFQTVDGYAADLKYPPENKHWDDQRVGSTLKFYGGEYNIVVIDPNEVVISAQSNQKKTTRPYQP